MPRSISLQLKNEFQKDGYRRSVYAQISLPGGGSVRVSDSTRTGLPIIKEPIAIPPIIVRDEVGFAEARSTVLVLSNTTSVAEGGSITRISETLDVEDIEGQSCQIYLFYSTDLLPIASSQLVFDGKIQAIESVSQHEVRVRVDDQAAYLARTLNHLVSDDYPEAPQAHASRLQPLMYGAHSDYAPVPVRVGQVGSLAEGISSAASSCVLVEDISPWPSSGLIQIGQELITYSGKTLSDGVYTLTGLTREQHGTSAASHEEGDAVLERPASYQFLIANRTYGAVTRVKAVRIGGKAQASTTWSFDEATNLLSITPANAYAGMRTTSRAQAISDGKWPVGGFTGAISVESMRGLVSQKHGGDPTQQPLVNPAHAVLIPWNAPSASHFYGVHTTESTHPTDIAVGDDDDFMGASSIKLEANVEKSWSASDFDTYLPPETILGRTGVFVDVTLMPRMVKGLSASGGAEFLIKSQGMRALRCTLGGVTIEHRVNPNGAFGNPQFTASTGNTIPGRQPVVEDAFVFDFTGKLDPANAPFALSLTAVCDGPNDGTHVARVQSVTQRLDGALPISGITGSCGGVLDSSPAAGVKTAVATFAETYPHALITVSMRAYGDFIRCDLGGGRIVRIALSSLHDTPSFMPTEVDGSPGRLGQWAAFSILVQNPGASISFMVCDHGSDGVPSTYVNDQSSAAAPADNVEAGMIIGSVVMWGLSSGGLTYPLLPAEKADSTFLAAFPEYPLIDVEGYRDNLSWNPGHDMVRNPAMVIRHYLERVMGQDSGGDTDLVSFVLAADAYPSYWSLAGLVLESEDMKGPLVRMLRDAAAQLAWEPTFGWWKLRRRALPEDLDAPSVDISPADWLPPNPVIVRTGDAEIVDTIRLRYRRNWNLPRSVDAYAAVVTVGSGDRARDDQYLCDFVRDAEHAQELAEFRLAWDAVALRRMSVNLRVKHIALDKYDVVSVTYPVGAGHLLNGASFMVENIGLVLGSFRTGTLTHLPVDLIEVPS